MSTDAPDTRLALPEGYTAEQNACGRLVIYATDTGAWLGEVTPHLANTQEVARELIASHEDAKARLEAPIVLDLGTVAEDEPTERADKNASRLREEELWRFARDNPRAAALHIRELERVAALAVDSLRGAGDEATAGIVRAALENRPE